MNHAPGRRRHLGHGTPDAAPTGSEAPGLLLAMAVEAVAEGTDVDGVLELTLVYACALTGAAHGMVSVHDDRGGVDRVITHGAIPLAGSRNGLAVPLAAAGADIGALHLGGREAPFRGGDTQVVAILARTAAAAVVRARELADLRTVEAAPRSLPERAQSLCEEYAEQACVTPRLTLTGPIAAVSDHVADQLLVTLSEALANVGRHASAGRVEVEVTASADWVMLGVVDDGVGLPQPARRGGGLARLQAGARSLGGVLRVARTSPGGTRLDWMVPSRAASSGSSAESPAFPAGMPPQSEVG